MKSLAEYRHRMLVRSVRSLIEQVESGDEDAQSPRFIVGWLKSALRNDEARAPEDAEAA